ncbi:MAG: protease inhibitor I42 family protein [bacterium]
MKKNIIVILIVLLVVSGGVYAVYYRNNNSNKPPPEKVKQTQRNKGATDRTLSVDEVDTIVLKTNKTTGYEWHYKIENENIVEIISDSYIRKSKDQKMGAGGERVLKLKGLKGGTTAINFKYYRNWEPEKTAGSKEIEIKVQEN